MSTEPTTPESDDPAEESQKPRPSRIKIGSQREYDTTGSPHVEIDGTEHEQREEALSADDTPDEVSAEEARAESEPPVTYPPPRIESTPVDLQEEIDAAIGDVSMDELLMGGDVAATKTTELEVDQRYPGTFVKAHREDIFFSLPGGVEGVAPAKQLPEIPEPGTVLEVVVTSYNTEDGLYELRIPGASVKVQDWSDLTEGAVVEARITGHNTGGLECDVSGIRGFIPASQVGLYRVNDLSEFVDEKLQCLVTEANESRRNLVLSHRAVLERERQEARQKLLDSLEVGQVHEGVVGSLRDFGAFVDLGGIDGLIHISRLSWDRVADPSEVLEEGQQVKVKIESVDRDTGKIGLSYRDLLEHPWEKVESKYPVNAIVRGTVSRITDFGAFVRLEAGVEGLVHISELAFHRVVKVDNVVQEGQEVDVKVLSVDRESQRMSLSLKAAQAAAGLVGEEEEPPSEEETEEAAPAKPTRPRRAAPLKGGVERKSGGEEFGLKW